MLPKHKTFQANKAGGVKWTPVSVANARNMELWYSVTTYYTSDELRFEDFGLLRC